MDEEQLMLYQLMRGQGLAGPEVGPVTLTDDMRDTMQVVRPKQNTPQSIIDMRRAIKNAFAQGGVNVDNVGQNRAQSPNVPSRPLPGLGGGPMPDGRNPYMESLFNRVDQIQAPGGSGEDNFFLENQQNIDELSAILGGQAQPSGGPTPNAPSGGQPTLNYAAPPEAGNAADMNDFVSEFQGAGFDGTTPQGYPEAEELADYGKSVSQFAKALETPGFQKFLGQMGIAFSRGNPNEPGTILGNAAVQGADAEVERRLIEGLMSGKDISEIELGGVPTSDALGTAFTLAQRQERLGQTERAQDFEEEMGRKEFKEGQEAQDFNEWMGQHEVAGMWQKLGLQAQGLEQERLELIADQNKENMPNDVESWQYGAALDAVAQRYLDIAKKAREQELSAQGVSPTLSAIQDAFSNEKTGFDPQAVLNYLPNDLRSRALTEAQQFSSVISADAQGGQSIDPEAFESALNQVGNIPVARTKAQYGAIPEGAWYRDSQGNLFQKGNE